jgi:hypothetical protein
MWSRVFSFKKTLTTAEDAVPQQPASITEQLAPLLKCCEFPLFVLEDA